MEVTGGLTKSNFGGVVRAKAWFCSRFKRDCGEGHGTPLQYSCLENPMNGGAWWAAVHGSLRVKHDWATGNPLQCSCLENPRDRGAWWAAVYGVAQSQTRLKRLSSSSSSSKRDWEERIQNIEKKNIKKKKNQKKKPEKLDCITIKNL